MASVLQQVFLGFINNRKGFGAFSWNLSTDLFGLCGLKYSDIDVW